MNIDNFFKPGNPGKIREPYSLPHLNNDKFIGYSNERIRETIEHNTREFFDVSLEKVRSKSRKREHVFPRHIIMYLLAHYTDYPFVQIGELYGGRDHTTVIHAKQTIASILSIRVATPEKQIINSFFYQFGYKVIEKEEQQQKAFVIDAHY